MSSVKAGGKCVIWKFTLVKKKSLNGSSPLVISWVVENFYFFGGDFSGFSTVRMVT